VKLKFDKNLAASVTLHVLVLGYGLVSFSSRSLEAPPPESMPVDIISADQLSKITAGSKTGEKDKPKPLVEKVADAKPVDDLVGKITEKPPVETAVAPTPPPMPVEKPVEKKPDPPKPVAEQKPKDEPKPIEKKPDPPKVDPIAEALKTDDSKKPPPKPEAKAAPPQPPKPKQERTFDQSKIAALLDKRDPTRQAATGAQLNSQASLGAAKGTAATLSQSELDALRARLTKLWNVQAGTERPEELIVDIRIRLTPDRRLAGPPEIVSRGTSPRYQAAADAAMRAVLQGQPFDMLQAATYEQWKDMIVTFDPRQMFHS
jgi:outer membrane biosynthesis protein TonB